MAFGDTGVLDDFNRSDEGPPPSSEWSTLIGSAFWEVISNQIEGATGTWAPDYYNVAIYAYPMEAFVTLGNAPSAYSSLEWGILNVGASWDGYSLQWMPSDGELYVERQDDASGTQLGATIYQACSAGYKMGIWHEADGTIHIYLDSGSGWSENTTRSDSTYTDPGYLGLATYAISAAQQFDDFGGGEVGGGSTVLVVQDATHGHTAENVALTQKQLLAVADATHSHTAEAPALVQAFLLTVADATHAHTADNLDLDIGSILLVVADAAHSHTAENVALTQKQLLTVADTLHAYTADNLDLVPSGAIELVVADATHSHTADNITIEYTAAPTLVVAGATHAHTADNIALTQKQLLTVADTLHAHTADTIDFGVGYQIYTADLVANLTPVLLIVASYLPNQNINANPSPTEEVYTG